MAISKEQREFEIYDEFFTVTEDDERIKEVQVKEQLGQEQEEEIGEQETTNHVF